MGTVFSNPKSKIIIVGLDNSGKSTLINHLQPEELQQPEITATVGFREEQFVKNKINFTVYDMSGQGKYRDLWAQYYESSEAIIFMIDAADHLRIKVAKNELEMLLQNEGLREREVPIIFFANKMDIASAMQPPDVCDGLELENIIDRPWHIQGCSAKTGDGVEYGMNWLTQQIKSNKDRKK